MNGVLIRLETSQAFVLDGTEFVVGSSPERTDLCIAGAELEPVHCRLIVIPAGLRIERFPNGEPDTGRDVAPGDDFQIGTAVLRLLAGSVISSPLSDETDDCEIEFAAADDSRDSIADDMSDKTATEVALAASSSTEPLNPQTPAGADSLWRVRVGSAEIGPLFWSSIEQMLQQGRLQAACLARPESGGPWLRLSLILADDDQWLTDEASEPEPDLEPAGPEHRRIDAAWNLDEMIAAARAYRPPDPVTPPEPARRNQSIASGSEAQFIIEWGHHEAGPLPRETVQELATQGRITAVTKTRHEFETDWSIAQDFGFEFPAKASPSGNRPGEPSGHSSIHPPGQRV